MNRTSRTVLASVASLTLVVAGGVAAHAGDSSDKQDDRNAGDTAAEVTVDALSEDDYGQLYLESIGASPDTPREVVGYDEELGVDIFDSPMGQFYVDEETADDAVDYDPLGVDPVLIPGVGEVEFITMDMDVDDLTPAALAEFEAAGVDVMSCSRVM